MYSESHSRQVHLGGLLTMSAAVSAVVLLRPQGSPAPSPFY